MKSISNTPLLAEPKIEPEKIVRALLDASQINNPPTDARIIAGYLNLVVNEFENHKDIGLNSPKIRAYISPSQRLIGIHNKLTPKQKNFSILHEIGHFVLPGHATHPDLIQNDLISDDGKNLSSSSIVQLEIEANQFAADCLFQLERFDLRVNTEDLNWDNIKRAADEYNASFEATARRWVEKSNSECALLVFNPAERNSEESPLKTMYTITSTSFRNNYFERLLSEYEMPKDSLIHRLFYQTENISEAILRVSIASRGTMDFHMQLFNNTYRVFGLLTPSS